MQYIHTYVNVHCIVLSEDVKAIKDCWIVGDEFLSDTFTALQEFKAENAVKPHIYEQYNMMPFFQSPLKPHPRVVKVLNSFIEGLNSTPKLPKYVLLIPDQDLIVGAKHLDYGVIHIIEEQIKWLFKQLNKVIARRREDLQLKRAGAILKSTHKPRLIWVSMINRPFATQLFPKKVMGLRYRFNALLKKYIEHERYMYFLRVFIPTHNVCNFTVDGQLSAEERILARHWSKNETIWSSCNWTVCGWRQRKEAIN